MRRRDGPAAPARFLAADRALAGVASRRSCFQARRDHDFVDPEVVEIARLPLPEDKRS